MRLIDEAALIGDQTDLHTPFHRIRKQVASALKAAFPHPVHQGEPLFRGDLVKPPQRKTKSFRNILHAEARMRNPVRDVGLRSPHDGRPLQLPGGKLAHFLCETGHNQIERDQRHMLGFRRIERRAMLL